MGGGGGSDARDTAVTMELEGERAGTSLQQDLAVRTHVDRQKKADAKRCALESSPPPEPVWYV